MYRAGSKRSLRRRRHAVRPRPHSSSRYTRRTLCAATRRPITLYLYILRSPLVGTCVFFLGGRRVFIQAARALGPLFKKGAPRSDSSQLCAGLVRYLVDARGLPPSCFFSRYRYRHISPRYPACACGPVATRLGTSPRPATVTTAYRLYFCYI